MFSTQSSGFFFLHYWREYWMLLTMPSNTLQKHFYAWTIFYSTLHCDLHNNFSIDRNLGIFFSCLWTTLQWKLLNQILPAFLVNPFKEIPKSGNNCLKDIQYFYYFLMRLAKVLSRNLETIHMSASSHENDSLSKSLPEFILF